MIPSNLARLANRNPPKNQTDKPVYPVVHIIFYLPILYIPGVGETQLLEFFDLQPQQRPATFWRIWSCLPSKASCNIPC